MKLVNGYRVDEAGKFEHREVYFRLNPRKNKSLHVHHIDGDKLNNKPDNLIGLEPAFHEWLHTFLDLPTRNEIPEYYNRWISELGIVERIRPGVGNRPKKKKWKAKEGNRVHSWSNMRTIIW